MPTSPKRNLAHLGLRSDIKEEIDSAVRGDLGDLTLRELLGIALSRMAYAERENYLRNNEMDKANGTYPRSLALGSLNVPFDVPRSRSSRFRPTLLPPHYQRGHPDSTRKLLLALLCSSRSINAAKTALRNLGVPLSEEALTQVATDFIEDFRLRNASPVPPDLLALFVDGKYVEVRDGDHLRPATIYVAVGLDREGTKRVLSAVVRPGRENIEDWKRFLRSLLERGLRRVLILVQDDFPGLLKLSENLFPKTDIQLCVVHMQRNVKSHLLKADAAQFLSRFRSIQAHYSIEGAAAEFDDLCRDFQQSAPAFIDALRKKRDHYLRFLAYPERIRRTLSTTNAVEAVNGQLERLRRNNGGYFHSESNLEMKLGITISYLENGSWKKPAANIRSVIDQLNAMFERRFELDP